MLPQLQRRQLQMHHARACWKDTQFLHRNIFHEPDAAPTPVKSPVPNKAEAAPVVSRLGKIGLAGVFTDRHLQQYASHMLISQLITIVTARQSMKHSPQLSIRQESPRQPRHDTCGDHMTLGADADGTGAWEAPRRNTCFTVYMPLQPER